VLRERRIRHYVRAMSNPNTTRMRALRITAPGDPGVLAVELVPRPEAGPNEILVRVAAAALNRADLLQRAGRYPAPPGSPEDIPGLEFAGTVAATGAGASRWRIGDRVSGLVGGGAQAEFLTTHEDAVFEVPDVLGLAEAAAVPEAFITVHDALVTQAHLGRGDRVLVFAVASGVGLAAVHLIRAMGAHAYGTTRTASKLDRVRSEGVTEGAAISVPDDIGRHVERWTDGTGVDIVLDLVGGDWAAAGISVLAPRGRLMCVGTLAGGGATIDLRRVLSRRLTIRGTVLRGRTLEEKIAATDAFARDALPLLASGQIRPVIDGIYPLESAAEAHARLERGDTIGKLVLTISPSSPTTDS
jgi:putative PIG3 family NAD(P)H quinone oxidoreductase